MGCHSVIYLLFFFKILFNVLVFRTAHAELMCAIGDRLGNKNNNTSTPPPIASSSSSDPSTPFSHSDFPNIQFWRQRDWSNAQKNKKENKNILRPKQKAVARG
jgi:hypothetical protein